MIRYREYFLSALTCVIVFLFLLTSCSNMPLIGPKKNEKIEKIPEGKTVSVEGMEKIKGVNPSKQETPSSPQKTTKVELPPPSGTKVSSLPTRPYYSPSLPFFQLGFKKKVVILEFENRTTYKDEKIGEAVAKKLSDKLEVSQRAVPVDKAVMAEMLNREGFKFDSLTNPSVMKRSHQSFGIQAFVLGMVTDVSLLSSKGSEPSEGEITFATAKAEIRLIDASTGNLLKSFIGRSPIFGTKETGEYSRSKAVLKAIDFCLDDIIEGFLRQLDLLDWTTTIAKIEGENIYINAGKLSGLRAGDSLEIFGPGKEIIHPMTKVSLGWTTGPLKGVIKVTELFGVDAAIGKVVQGLDFNPNDVVKSTMQK